MDLELGWKYKLGKKLGAGAFWEVDIAKDNTLGKEITVKLKIIEFSNTSHVSVQLNIRLY